MLLEVVFQYRTLIGKCDLGVGLDWDEIEGELEHVADAVAQYPHDLDGTKAPEAVGLSTA